MHLSIRCDMESLSERIMLTVANMLMALASESQRQRQVARLLPPHPQDLQEGGGVPLPGVCALLTHGAQLLRHPRRRASVVGQHGAEHAVGHLQLEATGRPWRPCALLERHAERVPPAETLLTEHCGAGLTRSVSSRKSGLKQYNMLIHQPR